MLEGPMANTQKEFAKANIFKWSDAPPPPLAAPAGTVATETVTETTETVTSIARKDAAASFFGKPTM